jgi:hypothetical protein
LSNVVLVEGRVGGTWRRVRAAGSIRLEVGLLESLRRPERVELDAAAQAFGRFLGRPVEIRTSLLTAA